MNMAFAVILSAALGGAEAPSARSGLASTYTGNAFDLKTGKVVYVEEHREILDGDRRVGIVTEYKTPLGVLFARRNASFKPSQTIPGFTTEDLRDGYAEGAEVRNDSVRLFWREDRSTPFEEKVLPIPASSVVDAGFNNFVQANWDKLRDGKTLTLQFGVPASLDYYQFRLYKKSEQRVGDRTLMTVICDIDNFLIRLFVDPIVLTYDTDVRRLVTYEGISNIRDDDGENYEVRIVFDPYGP